MWQLESLLLVFVGFPGGSESKESAWNVGNLGFQSLGWEDPLEKGMATQSSILAWKKNAHKCL